MQEEVKPTPPTPEAPAPPPAAPSATPPVAPAPDQKDIEENKGITVLSYIGILCLVPLLAKKDSKFAQYHAKQGLVLFIAEVCTTVITIIPYLGWIIGLANILWLILLIMGIINVVNGQYKEIPLLGKFGAKFNF